MVQIDDGALRFGIRISLCYLIVFLFAIVSQTYRKFEQMFKIKKEGKRFVRWDPTNAAMMAADRAVGNCMEWGPVFLILIWCNILAGEAPDTIAFSAWLWLAARGFYIVLVIFLGSYGVGGPRVAIFLATVPAYAALGMLFMPLLPYLQP